MSVLSVQLSHQLETGFSLDVDIELPLQGVTAIFGPSGAGKTTLLRGIAGLDPNAQGTVRLDQQNWLSATQNLPTYKRPLAYVFQEASLFAHLNVQQNLAFAEKRALPSNNPVLRDDIIALFDLGPLLARDVQQLSGGERQRVAIARALLRQPQLLLLDEPLASLDDARKQEILPYLVELKSQFGMPMLYVTHAMNEVVQMADHLLLLDKGRVQAQGPINQVLSHTQCSGLAQEAPSVLVVGTVVERDRQWQQIRVSFDQGDLWLSDKGEAPNSYLRLRIFAKDISLSLNADEQSSIVNRLPVRVAAIQPADAEGMQLVELSAGQQPLLAQLSRRSVAKLALVPGMGVWAQIKAVALAH